MAEHYNKFNKFKRNKIAFQSHMRLQLTIYQRQIQKALLIPTTSRLRTMT